MLETWRQIKVEASEIMPQDVRSWGRDGDRGRRRGKLLSQSLPFTPPTSVSVGSGISTSWEVGQVLWAFREGEDVPLSDFRVSLGHSWTPVPRMKTIKAVRSMQCVHLPAASGGPLIPRVLL